MFTTRNVLLMILLLIMGGGCCSVQKDRHLGKDEEIHQYSIQLLLRDYDHTVKSLLLSPSSNYHDPFFAKWKPATRERFLKLFGEPLATCTNHNDHVEDEYQLTSKLTLTTRCYAADSKKSNRFIEAHIHIKGELEPVSWRMKSSPPLMSTSLLKEKIDLIRNFQQELHAKFETIEKTKTLLEGRLVRTYREKAFLEVPTGIETWHLDGHVVAKGTYQYGSYWEGTFLVDHPNPPGGDFTELVLHEGKLQLSLYPEWAPPAEDSRAYSYFQTEPATNSKLDDLIYADLYKLFERFGESPFLKWAENEDVTEGYRLVIRPSFNPAIVINLIIQSKKGPPRFEWIITDWQDPDRKTVKRKTVMLTRSEVKEIKKMISDSLFWSNRQTTSQRVCDGTIYHYEGLKDGTYIYRNQLSPEGYLSSTLVWRLLQFVPTELMDPRSAIPNEFDDLHLIAHVSNKTIEVLEYFGRTDLVDRMMTNANPELLAQCIREAQSIIDKKELDMANLVSFEALTWDLETGLLVHPECGAIEVSSNLCSGSPAAYREYQITYKTEKRPELTITRTFSFNGGF